MTNQAGSWTKVFVPPCSFKLNTNDQIPDDTQLTSSASKCGIHDSDFGWAVLSMKGSCYAEAIIDYNTDKIEISATRVPFGLGAISPYDDMFGLFPDIDSVVQYKINGNLQKEEVQMITRIQCRTYDNCALDKLRKLYPKLVIVAPRLEIFTNIKDQLNSPAPASGLSCKASDDDTTDVSCTTGEDRCLYDLAKTGVSKSCTTYSSGATYDIVYRFNVIEEMKSPANNNSKAGLKCYYLCAAEHCNSNDAYEEVSASLQSFALVSESKPEPKPDPDSSEEINNNHKSSPKKSSGSVSFVTSFYSRSIFIISLFICILSN